MQAVNEPNKPQTPNPNTQILQIEKDKIKLVHDCLYFEHKKQKYLYGLTYLLIGSKFLTKNRVDYFIVPGTPFVNYVFLWAGLEAIIGRSEHKQKEKDNPMITKMMKIAKIVSCNQKTYHKYFDSVAHPSTPIKQCELSQPYLTNLHKKLSLESYLSDSQSNEPQILDWLNAPKQQVKIIVPELGTSTYLCQQTNIIAVDPSQEFVSFLKNNNILKRQQMPGEQGQASLANIGNAGNVGNVGEDKNREKEQKSQKIQKIQKSQKSQKSHKDKEMRGCSLLELLRVVVVTKVTAAVAVVGLLIADRVQKIRVLAINQELQTTIIENSRKYLNYPEQLTRSRLLIRQQQPLERSLILAPSNPYNLQNPSSLCLTYIPLSVQSPSLLQVQLGSSTPIATNKKILFSIPSSQHHSQLCPELETMHFPKQLSQAQLQYMVMYNIAEPLMKELKQLPQPLRKKVILNRSEHKYNHKYFMTFQKNKIEYCTVTDTQFLQLVQLRKIGKTDQIGLTDVCSKVKFKNITEVQQIGDLGAYLTFRNRELANGWKLYQLGHRASMELCGHVLQVIEGIAEVQLQNEQGQPCREVVVGHGNKSPIIQTPKQITSLKHSKIRITFKQQHKIHTQKFPLLISPPTNPLQQIPQNSLLLYLTQQQKQILSSLCESSTYEVGLKINNHNQFVYFISKGGMKWEDHDQVATNGCFIGDVFSYYALKEAENALEEFDNYIEVIKDTWAVYIRIQEFHRFFLYRFPDVLHFIYKNGKIFH